MSNAVLIGNYGATNLGDEAILDNILKAHPEINFTVFSHNPTKTTRHHPQINSTYPLPFGLRSLLRGNFQKSFQALKTSDFVIIGGGGLFTDEKIKAILLWSWHFFWASLYRKPVFFYANSIGPLNSKIGRYITKKVLRKADFITVRDEASATILRNFGVTNFEVTADPAFLHQVPQPLVRKKQVAISLRNWIKYENQYLSAIKKTIQELEKQGYQILLISMQNLQDDDRRIFSLISSEKSLTIAPCDFTELIAILQKCEFTIGMRLHFLIASALANTPFLTLSYSQKTDSLAKSLAMEEFALPLAEISAQTLETNIEKMRAQKTQISTKITEKVAEEKIKAKKNKTVFDLIFQQQK